MKDIKYYISEKLRIGKNYKSNQEFDNWDEFKEYLESIDIKVTKNSRFWWWLESKEKSIKCLVSPTGDDFFFINSRADTNEGIIYINEDGKWVALPANNYKFDLTVDEDDKPAFKYSSNTADILKKILSGEFNVTEKLHIGKDFDNTHTDISIKEFLQELDDNDMMLEEIKDAARNEVGRLICLKPNNFPVMRIKLEENYFNSWYLDDKKYVLRVLSNPLDEYESSYEKILDINEYGFRYTRNNAKLLYHILKTEGKVEVTEKLHINKDYKSVPDAMPYINKMFAEPFDEFIKEYLTDYWLDRYNIKDVEIYAHKDYGSIDCINKHYADLILFDTDKSAIFKKMINDAALNGTIHTKERQFDYPFDKFTGQLLWTAKVFAIKMSYEHPAKVETQILYIAEK